MKIPRYIKQILLIALLLLVFPIHAADYLLPNKANGIDLSDYVSYVYSDAESPTELLLTQPHFMPINGKKFKPTPEKLWYKIDLIQGSMNKQPWFINTMFPNVPLLRAYMLDDKGTWQLIFNDTKPFSERYFQHPLIVIPIENEKSTKISLLIEYTGFANIPLEFKLYDKKSIESERLLHITINSGLVAFSLIIFILSVFQLTFTPNYKSAALAALSLSISFYLSEVAGFNFQFMWPQSPHINKYTPNCFILLTYISYFFFTVQLFDLKKRAPRLNKTYIGLMAFMFSLLLFNLFIDVSHAIIVTLLLLAPLPLLTGIWAYKKRLWTSQFFILGALCNVLLNNVYAALTSVGVINLTDIHITMMTKLGFILELLFFTVAIVYLTGRYKKELTDAEKHKRIEAQKLLRMERENHALLIKRKQELYKKELIEERTTLMEVLVEKKNQLLADISHELVTPLTVLKLQVESLKDGMEDDVNAAYDALDLKLKDLEKLIQDIQLFSQCDSGILQLDLQKANARALLSQWQKEMELCFSATNLSFSFVNNIPEELIVNIDLSKIKQTLLNILNNSIKYTDQPGEVVFEAKLDNERISFITEDSAPSIDDKHLTKVFERLYRVESSRNRETGGSGLGLAICKGLTRAHDGDIHAEKSTLGGLKIVVSLPI
jgi:signal transduction histidine kinase